MAKIQQELMTPDEAARWFRRSISWLRKQKDLLRFGTDRAQPLFHVDVCRAYVLGKLSGLTSEELRQVQIQALAVECRLSAADELAGDVSGEVPRMATA